MKIIASCNDLKAGIDCQEENAVEIIMIFCRLMVVLGFSPQGMKEYLEEAAEAWG